MVEEQEQVGEKIGEITHFFSKISVGIIKISEGSLKVGDKIMIKGFTSNVEQGIESMQLNHQNIQEAKVGDEIGIKVSDIVRAGDVVFKIQIFSLNQGSVD